MVRPTHRSQGFHSDLPGFRRRSHRIRFSKGVGVWNGRDVGLGSPCKRVGGPLDLAEELVSALSERLGLALGMASGSAGR